MTTTPSNKPNNQRNSMQMWAWHEAVQFGSSGNDVLQQEWTLTYESIQRAV